MIATSGVQFHNINPSIQDSCFQSKRFSFAVTRPLAAFHGLWHLQSFDIAQNKPAYQDYILP